MKKIFLIVLAAVIASPAYADDSSSNNDEALTIAKMQAQLSALADQNRALNGKVEDLQHQLVTPPAAASQAASMPYGMPVPTPQNPQSASQPVAEMPPPAATGPTVIQSTTTQPYITPAAPAQAQTPPVIAFPRADDVPPQQAIPYTPTLQGESAISSRSAQQSNSVTVIGADGSVISKPNPYVTKVAPPASVLAPLPVAQPDEETLEDEFDKIFQNVANEDYAAAKPQLKDFITKHPGTDLSGEAYFWLGEIATAEKNYNEAAINYLKGYKEAPTGNKAPENILKMSLTLKQLGKNAEACKYIARFDNEFPNAHPDLRMQASDARAELGCK